MSGTPDNPNAGGSYIRDPKGKLTLVERTESGSSPSEARNGRKRGPAGQAAPAEPANEVSSARAK